MHDLGESSCISAQASRAETGGDHVHNHACTLDRTQGCKLANGTLFYELCESVPDSNVSFAFNQPCSKGKFLLPFVHVSPVLVVESVKNTAFAAFVHLAFDGVS